MNIPELVKAKRKEIGESQAEFGKRFGISHAAVSDMERGITKGFTSDILQFIFTFEKRKCSACNGKGFTQGFKNLAL